MSEKAKFFGKVVATEVVVHVDVGGAVKRCTWQGPPYIADFVVVEDGVARPVRPGEQTLS